MPIPRRKRKKKSVVPKKRETTAPFLHQRGKEVLHTYQFRPSKKFFDQKVKLLTEVMQCPSYHDMLITLIMERCDKEGI
jgi:hypothetical protein